MKAGVSLIETLVVISIITSLSLIGINTINNFRKDAILDTITNEFISAVRDARSKSMNGDLLPGESTHDFSDSGLPEYGLHITPDSYSVIRQCTRNNGTNCSTDAPLITITLDPNYIITPAVSLYFDRISGDTTGKVINLREKNGNLGRQINITSNFVISVTKL